MFGNEGFLTAIKSLGLSNTNTLSSETSRCPVFSRQIPKILHAVRSCYKPEIDVGVDNWLPTEAPKLIKTDILTDLFQDIGTFPPSQP
jgi:hypothetical protein